MGWKEDRTREGEQISDISPSSEGTEAEGNESVRKLLREQGDSCTQPRHVIHYAYRQVSPVTCEEMAGILEGGGFGVSQTPSAEGLVFEHQSRISAPDFDRFTERLVQMMNSKGWVYDGWECATVKDLERKTV